LADALGARKARKVGVSNPTGSGHRVFPNGKGAGGQGVAEGLF
jgi:hypothetical protein